MMHVHDAWYSVRTYTHDCMRSACIAHVCACVHACSGRCWRIFVCMCVYLVCVCLCMRARVHAYFAEACPRWCRWDDA